MKLKSLTAFISCILICLINFNCSDSSEELQQVQNEQNTLLTLSLSADYIYDYDLAFSDSYGGKQHGIVVKDQDTDEFGALINEIHKLVPIEKEHTNIIATAIFASSDINTISIDKGQIDGFIFFYTDQEGKHKMSIYDSTNNGDFEYTKLTYPFNKIPSYSLQYLLFEYYNNKNFKSVLLFKDSSYDFRKLSSSKNRDKFSQNFSYLAYERQMTEAQKKSKECEPGCEGDDPVCDYTIWFCFEGTMEEEDNNIIATDVIASRSVSGKEVLNAFRHDLVYGFRDKILKNLKNGTDYIDLYYSDTKKMHRVPLDLKIKTVRFFTKYNQDFIKIIYPTKLNRNESVLKSETYKELASLLDEYGKYLPSHKSTIDKMKEDALKIKGMSYSDFINSDIFID